MKIRVTALFCHRKIILKSNNLASKSRYTRFPSDTTPFPTRQAAIKLRTGTLR